MFWKCAFGYDSVWSSWGNKTWSMIKQQVRIFFSPQFDQFWLTLTWLSSQLIGWKADFFCQGGKQNFFVIVWSVLSHPDVTFFMIDWVESSASMWWESTICEEQSLCSHCYWHCQRVHLWTRRVTLDVGVQGKIPLAGPKHDNWYWSFGC